MYIATSFEMQDLINFDVDCTYHILLKLNAVIKLFLFQVTALGLQRKR